MTTNIGELGLSTLGGIVRGLNKVDEPWRRFPHTVAEKLARGRWIAYGYLVFISQIIADAVERGNARVIINMPPRHGKSKLISHFTPVWYFNQNPEKRIILSSHGQNLATHWGRQVRNSIQENAKLLDLRIAPDSSAGGQWELTAGGGMLCAGIGGMITGFGMDLGLIDDVVKDWKDANSENKQEGNVQWFNSTFYTRLEPGGSIIVLMTRWGLRDLAGYLMLPESEGGHKDDWEVICLPALAEENDPIGRAVDEPLNPLRKTYEELDSLRQAKGNFERQVWAGLWQQRPTVAGGHIIKTEWWKYYEKLPPKEYWIRIVQSWDTAMKEGQRNDFTVGTTWLEAIWPFGNGDMDDHMRVFYLLDVVRERLEYPEMKRLIIWKRAEFQPSEILIEDKASGISVIQDLIKEGIPVTAIPKAESKVYLANLVSGVFEEGRVFAPAKAPYMHRVLTEYGNFPNDEHDDIVDSGNQALNYMDGRTGPMVY